MRSCLITLLLLFCGISKAQDIDVLHYAFRLSLGDESDTITGVTNITFVMKTDTKVAAFDLVNVNKNGKGMHASLVTDDNNDSVPLPFSHTAGKLLIQLPKARRNDTCNVSITYQGVPADGLIISKNKFGERTFFADNWPNRAHHWIPCVDRPDDKASFEFVVGAPSHYQVVSNGIKTEEKASGTRTRTRWQEDTPLSTKVMVIGVARFAVKTFSESPDNLPISAWVYPKDSTKGFYDYGLAPQLVKFFSNYIAPFPFSKLANVQSTTIFGGMENASCIFYAENSVTGDRSSEALQAHEIAHQWFGDAASEKSFAHLWLSEGFATYLTHLYFEQKYGEKVLRKRLQDDRNEILDFAKKALRPVVDSTENLMSLLNANSYQKGGWVLHMLRSEVGDAAFQKIVQAYYQQFKGGNAETRDLQVVAENISGKNLKWFFDQWLYQPGVPKLNFSYHREKDTLAFNIRQDPDRLFNLRVDVLVEMENGEKFKFNERITTADSNFKRFVGLKKIRRITLDPDQRLLFTGQQTFNF